MRHNRKRHLLGRTASHRRAMLSNLAQSLIIHKRITTTLAKAKALRPYIEPILTRAKQDDMHSRRVIFSHFQDKAPLKILFNDISPRIQMRAGGYTRIVRLPSRPGDQSQMALIELVDYSLLNTPTEETVAE